MPILRNPLRDRFSVIDNRALEDERLSYEAKGLLAYLLSKPDGWEINPKHLAKVGGCGRDKITRILNELRQAGYIEDKRPRSDDGKVRGQEITLREVPDTGGLKTRPPVEPDAGKTGRRENRPLSKY